MYEVGKVYVWYNQVGEWAILNGVKTTVTANAVLTMNTTTGVREMAWDTDTLYPYKPEDQFDTLSAFAGDLRPYEPPNGERFILSLFTQPELELA